MRRSTNYNLYLPENSDYRDISALTYNFETIDSAMASIKGRSEAMETASNLNDCVYAGSYMFNTSTENTPKNGYGICFVVSTKSPESTGTGWVNQIAITTSSTPDIWVRKRINNGSWTGWTQITTEYYDAAAATAGPKFNMMQSRVQRTGTMIECCIRVQATSNYGNSDVIAVVPSGFRPTVTIAAMWSTLFRNGAIVGMYPGAGSIQNNGNIYQDYTAGGGVTGDECVIYLVYSMI